MPASPPFGSVITVVASADPVIDHVGLEPTSPYVEYVWLPRLGPSATWMYRRLSSGLRTHPEGYQLEVAYLAHAMGLGAGTGTNSPVQRSLGRLVCFGLARRDGDNVLAVRRRAPWLNAANARRLDPRLQRIHDAVLANHRPRQVAQAS